MTQAVLVAGFTLLEYLRSGRIFLELIATIACYVILLRPTSAAMNASYLFAVLGIFGPGMAVITTGFIVGLGDRPQNYIVLTHNVSRDAFLLGLFFAAVIVTLAMYGILCALVALFNRATDLTLFGWTLATLPLILNTGLVAAIALLLSPPVLSAGWRLFVLALIALALSSNVISGPVIAQISEINPLLVDLLRAIQTILSGPLVPVFYGYQLSVSRAFDSAPAWANLLAQCLLLLSFLGLARYGFHRRDLIFSV
ncbi:hypothetical protein [Chloroflexus sp.]|uniref:hypothetical protein n=1 Tax=Chloroflexus sp. TaxID=1904827 RepID=UPI0026285315|nr:hypothetical protein [uncultured Chloroflexus sp.]